MFGYLEYRWFEEFECVHRSEHVCVSVSEKFLCET